MPDRINAAEHGMQPVGFEPTFDLPSGDACSEKLGTGHDPVLPCRERRDHGIGSFLLLQTTYLVFNCRGSCHGGEFGAAGVAGVLRG